MQRQGPNASNLCRDESPVLYIVQNLEPHIPHGCHLGCENHRIRKCRRLRAVGVALETTSSNITFQFAVRNPGGVDTSDSDDTTWSTIGFDRSRSEQHGITRRFFVWFCELSAADRVSSIRICGSISARMISSNPLFRLPPANLNRRSSHCALATLTTLPLRWQKIPDRLSMNWYLQVPALVSDRLSTFLCHLGGPCGFLAPCYTIVQSSPPRSRILIVTSLPRNPLEILSSAIARSSECGRILGNERLYFVRSSIAKDKVSPDDSASNNVTSRQAPGSAPVISPA